MVPSLVGDKPPVKQERMSRAHLLLDPMMGPFLFASYLMPILFKPVVTDQVPADRMFVKPLIGEPTSIEEMLDDMD
jgi:hypothetical protein